MELIYPQKLFSYHIYLYIFPVYPDWYWNPKQALHTSVFLYPWVESHCTALPACHPAYGDRYYTYLHVVLVASCSSCLCVAVGHTS